MVAKLLLLCSCVLLCVQESRQQRADYCSLEAASGMCDAYFPRFYYNPESDSCEHFIYGGCQGNENNFETVADCEAACSPGRATDYCKLAPETGPCEALFHRFYYNSATGDCEDFVYGGCQGNQNNFETLVECQKACVTA